MSEDIPKIDRASVVLCNGSCCSVSSRTVATSYAYILKSKKVDNLYKFGKTIDLSRRVNEVNSKGAYRGNDFIPYAFAPYDIELRLLQGLFYSGAEPYIKNSKGNRYTEAYYLDNDDLQFIIDCFGFRLIVDDIVPSTIFYKRETTRYYLTGDITVKSTELIIWTKDGNPLIPKKCKKQDSQEKTESALIS